MFGLFLFSFLQLSSPVVFESLAHNFGAHTVDESELKCSFVFHNSSDRNVSIAYAVATCSCTTLSWTTEDVSPGGTGSIDVTYHIELFVDSFQKQISVFFDGFVKPVLLSITGSLYDTPETLAAAFPFSRSGLGFGEEIIDLGTLAQGVGFHGRLFLANLSGATMHVGFNSSSAYLSVSPLKLEIEAGCRAFLDYTVNPDSLVWGRQSFELVPEVNGISCDPVFIKAVVIEDFSSLSPAERNNGPSYQLFRDAYSFGMVKRDSPVLVQIPVKNVSSQPLLIRQCSGGREEITVEWPGSIEPGTFGTINVNIGAQALVPGANSIYITLVTNSPLKPFAEVEIVGYVE